MSDSVLKQYLGGWTEDALIRDSVRMKGDGREDEHSPPNKLWPSDPLLKKSWTGDTALQYAFETPLEGSPCVIDMIPWWFMVVDKSQPSSIDQIVNNVLL